MLRYVSCQSWVGNDRMAHVEFTGTDARGERRTILLAFESGNDLSDAADDMRHTGLTMLRDAPRPKQ